MATSLSGFEIDLFENIGHIILRLVVALLLGGLIGFEREVSRKAAGLRTNILICVGAAAFTIVSLHFEGRDGMVDVSRVAAQIVTGIGFLGAGTIIQARGEVQGLTSAATIWVVAAIGLAVGAGYFSLAVVTTALVIVALFILGWLEKAIAEERKSLRYEITVENSAAALENVQEVLREPGVDLRVSDITKEGDVARISVRVEAAEAFHQRLSHVLAPLPEVRKIRSD